MPKRQNYNIGVFGVIGSGKTTHALKRAREADRLIVFDTLHLIDLKEEKLAWCDDIRKLIEWTRRQKNFRVVYLPSIQDKEAEFEMVVQLCMLIGNVSLLLDEVDVFCDANYTPQVFFDLIMYGRHPQVSTIYTARRFANVSRNLTSQTHELVIFRQEEPVDIDSLKKRLGPEWGEAVAKLPNYHAVVKAAGEIRLMPPQ